MIISPARFILPPCLLLAIGSLWMSTAEANSTQQTIQYALPRVVKIFGAGGIRQLHSYGTGIIVSPQGHIATVWSHVLDADEVTVMTNDGRRYPAKVLGAEPQLDVAVIKIQAENLSLPYFDLTKATRATPGTRVLGFSNMFMVATGDEPVSVLHGVIASVAPLSARRGAFEVPYTGEVYVVDAVTNNPGSGGGILMSRDGKLLGLIGKELRNTASNTWLNYAVPLTELRETIKQIVENKFVSRDKKIEPKETLARYKPIDFGIVLVPDVVFRTPAFVLQVLPGSPAEKAGIRTDDLILFANDELVQSAKVLGTTLGKLEGGDKLRLIVRRGGQLITVEMDVAKKPAP